MGVDGNGTGALLKRSHTSGGKDGSLMVTSNKRLAYPIDSGKDGMEANDTKRKTQSSSSNSKALQFQQQTGTRLVRHNLSPPSSSSSEESPPQQQQQSKLVFAPAAQAPANGNSNGATGGTTGGVTTKAANSSGSGSFHQTNMHKTKLVRYNGPDLDNTTDYDGMELSSSKKQRQKEIQLSKKHLVLYSPPDPLSAENENDSDEKNNNDEENQKQKQQHRPALSKDIHYSDKYVERTDYTMARKTGLAVNKPISLWVERDKFL